MTVWTTVETVFNGIHTEPDTGVVHGHDYLVRASWKKAIFPFANHGERVR